MRFGKRRPSLKFGLPLMLIGIGMVSVGWGYVSPRLVNGKPPPCFPQSCPDLGPYAILFLAGLPFILWGGLETFFGVLVRLGLIQPQLTPSAPPEVGTGPEDQIILSIAREFHNQYRFPKRRPINNVAWSEIQPWYWAGFKWQGFRKPSMLVLSAGLRGRLEVEDWRTLLQYYFLVMKPRARFFLTPLFGYFVAPFMLVIFVGAGISYDFGRQLSIVYAQLVATPIIVILLVLLFPAMRRAALKQDQWVAKSMSPGVLAGLFQKIDGLHVQEIENSKRRHGLATWVWPIPNTTQRIDNLSL